MQTWEVLEKAADLMDARGKAVGTLCNDAGALCAQGAALEALGASLVWKFNGNHHKVGFRQEEFVPAMDALRRAIGTEVAAWNNSAVSKDEVTATLRAVAATEKARAARLLPVVVERAKEVS